MAITGAQTTLLYEANDQMAIPRPTLAQLWNEGITTIDDFGEFNKDVCNISLITYEYLEAESQTLTTCHQILCRFQPQ